MQVVEKGLDIKMQGIGTTLCDCEWRIFKEWVRVIPDEPFYAFKYESIKKRALKEGLNISNLYQ